MAQHFDKYNIWEAKMLLSIPWLILPVLAYFGIAFFTGDIQATLDYAPIDNVVLMSGAIWKVTVGQLLIIFTLIILFVEIIKATRVSGFSLVDHSLSTVVFIVCLVLFLAVETAGTSTFFLITVMTLIDVVAGFSITLRSARRDVGFATSVPH